MDHALEVKVPSFCFEGFLIINSILLWFQGAGFLLLGVVTYHLLKVLFMDDYGIKSSGVLSFLFVGVGIALVLGSYITNIFLMFPNMYNYALLALIYGIILLFQIIVCIFGFFYTNRLNIALKSGISRIMENYNARSYLNAGLNAIQQHLQCCGSYGYASWFDTTYANKRERVPASCCRDLMTCHNLEPLVVEDIFKAGCFQKIDSYKIIADSFLLGAIIGNLIIQIFAIISALKMGIRYKQIYEIDSIVPIEF